MKKQYFLIACLCSLPMFSFSEGAVRSFDVGLLYNNNTLFSTPQDFSIGVFGELEYRWDWFAIANDFRIGGGETGQSSYNILTLGYQLYFRFYMGDYVFFDASLLGVGVDIALSSYKDLDRSAFFGAGAVGLGALIPLTNSFKLLITSHIGFGFGGYSIMKFPLDFDIGIKWQV